MRTGFGGGGGGGGGECGQHGGPVALPTDTADRSGRLDFGTQVDEIQIRTTSGTTLRFNGGGGNAVPGMAFLDPVYGNPVEEEWTIFPASSLDYATGVRRSTAQVPAEYEDRVDLSQPSVSKLRVCGRHAPGRGDEIGPGLHPLRPAAAADLPARPRRSDPGSSPTGRQHTRDATGDEPAGEPDAPTARDAGAGR